MNYFLAEACKNTFVLFDYMKCSSIPPHLLLEVLITLRVEQRDDALILTQAETKGDSLFINMLVLGPDGAFGEFCGNGARACAAYLFEHYPNFKSYFLKTQWGLHPLLRHHEGVYSIQLPPHRCEANSKFIMQVPAGFHYVEMIEPHLIIESAMSDEELLGLGKKLNQQKSLFPLGINVNAWQQIGKDYLHVKTYERGVQRLTQSCGTGSVSCAAFYKTCGTVNVLTPGGALEISIKEGSISLKGPAFVSCTRKKAELGL